MGGFGKLAGRYVAAALIAACTSCSATSIFSFRSNCSVISEAPNELIDVIWFRPGTSPNWRSSGVVTADAVTSGLAPGIKRQDLNRRIIHLRQC